jgi:beta-lactamase regulating signal transducer with metallopeptidase domain
MQDFIIALLICSATMSVVALLYMAFAPLASRRYSEKWRYYMWLIIALGFVILFRPSPSNTVVSLEIPIPVVMPVFFVETVADMNAAASVIAATTTESIPSTTIPWWQIAFAIWLGGAIIFPGYHIVSHIRFMKTVRRWSERVEDAQTLALFEQVKAELGIKNQATLYTSPFGSPMAIGIFKFKIFLPQTDIEPSELHFILTHELIHCKRMDLLYKYLVMAVRSIHWFNPVTHLMAREIDMLCETSCDAEVVQGAAHNTRQSYSEALIGVAQHQSKLKTAFSTNFYMGRNGMKTRISTIMDTGKKRTALFVACILAMLTIGTGFVFATTHADAPSVEGRGGFYTSAGDTLLFIYHPEDAAIERFDGIHMADHSLVWETSEYEAQLIMGANRRIYNLSIIHFTHYHDGAASEDLFIKTRALDITDVLIPGEAVLIYNYAPPPFVPWSIISFYDDVGQRYFFTLFAYYYLGFGMLDITSQVRFE